MVSGGHTVPRIEKSEHIGPDDTGDNIMAKRVANYYWDGVNWQRVGAGLVPTSYDYIALSNYDANNNPGTIIYKQGGASGTTVATLTLTYSGTNITSVART